MKKSLKKILALALAGSMMLGMLGISSLAEDNTDSVILDSAEVVVNPDLAVQPESLPEEEELPVTLEEEEPPAAPVEDPAADEPSAEGDLSGSVPAVKEFTLSTLPEVVEDEDNGIMLLDEEPVRQNHPITLIYHRMVEDTTSSTGASETDTFTKDSMTGPCTGTEHAIYMRDCDPRNAGWGKTGWIGWGKTPNFDEKWEPFDFAKNWKFFPVDPENDVVHIYLFFEAENKTDFTLTYNSNGGESENWTETFRSTADYFDAAVSEAVPRWAGYDFQGWALAEDATSADYQGGDSVRLTETATTLYAVWTPHVHVPEEIPAVSVTCTESGWTAGSRCQVCGEILVAPEEIRPAGHDMVAEENRAATCTEDGWHGGAHCKNCDHKVDPIVDKATGHTPETDPAVPATCTEPGLTAGSHCSVCHGVIAPQEPVEALGHEWNEEEFISDESRHWHVCQREDCTEVKDTTDHTWNEGELTTPATCEGEGVRTFTCTVCGRTRTETVPASGHSWDNGVVTLSPTTSRPGVRTYTCTVCGEQRLETIARLPGGGGGSSSGGGGTTTPSRPEEELPEEDLGDEDVPLAELPFPFEDVSEDDWFYNSVKYVYGKGIMASVLKSRYIFGPMADTSRNMVVTVLYRLDSTDELSEMKVPLTGEPVQFSDQALIPVWANEAVAWAVSNGVVEGYRDGSFGGERDITRQELAAMLYRYAGSKGCDVSARADLSVFEDADSVAKYAREAMSWAVGAGIIRGMSETWLDPAGTATRAHVAATLERFCEMVEAGKGQA